MLVAPSLQTRQGGQAADRPTRTAPFLPTPSFPSPMHGTAVLGWTPCWGGRAGNLLGTKKWK